MIGGANSAGQGAMMFSSFAARVTMVIRGSSLAMKMSQYLVEQVQEQDNIEVLLNCEVVEVGGETSVEQVRLRDGQSGEEEVRDANAVFFFVGAVPHSAFISELVRTNDRGFIYTGPDIFAGEVKPESWNVERDPFLLETSVPGIFAAGDVRHGALHRVASAVGQGSVVISMVHKYLESV